MKIFCVDTFTDGHHRAYMKGLCGNMNFEFVFAIPHKVPNLPNDVKQYEVPYDIKKRGFINDIHWIRKIHLLVKREKPDIVHFLYGDLWYRYFGFGLNIFKRYKTVVTFHVVPEDIKHQLSVKCISQITDACVVHTDKLLEQFEGWGIKNAVHVEYPCFFPIMDLSPKIVKKDLGIPTDAVVFGCLGGTRKYKGLDFILDALNNVDGNFHLLIAGAEEYFTEDFIQGNSKQYSDRITLILHQLSDDEFMRCIIASDWIVLPYRKAFTGASGPLAEGVMYGKRILGTNTGSIGNMIIKHDLGITFESENIVDLSKAIKLALEVDETKTHSEMYTRYQKSLFPKTFAENYKRIYKGISCNED